jgi:hypothetical protein
MDNPKLRKTLINLHLLFAAFMAPAFILVAVSGGLYLTGNKGQVSKTDVALPAAAVLDFKSASIEDDVRSLLSEAGIKHKFEYVRNRGSRIELRPTSKTYLEISQTPSGLKAARVKPNFQKSMMELHKGHGPKLFKTYQKLVALALIGVVLGGFMVGLLAKAYRRKTIVATVLGLLAFLGLALF